MSIISLYMVLVRVVESFLLLVATVVVRAVKMTSLLPVAMRVGQLVLFQQPLFRATQMMVEAAVDASLQPQPLDQKIGGRLKFSGLSETDIY